MNRPATTHPDVETLHDFVLGKLPAGDAARIEAHLSTCDECAGWLTAAPDDTLVRLAREAATQSFKIDRAKQRLPGNEEVPAELVDHPRYKIVGLLGTGGMGAVYKAEHRLMERLVALKVINKAFTGNPLAVERFRREVRAAARLAHPNIVTAFDAEQAGELHFLVMEYVDGVSLDRLVARQGPLTPTLACSLMRQAAIGLAHAHDKQMIHRDIKPHNLMVTRKGQLKILDFGLARLYSDSAATAGNDDTARPDHRASETAAGMVVGTPDYMAPEQIRHSSSADARSDLYSLGCTFYFLLTGKPPFAAGTVVEKLALQLTATPEPIETHRSDLPADLVRIVNRMLAKQPDERFQSASDLARDLTPLTKGAAPAAPLPPPVVGQNEAAPSETVISPPANKSAESSSSRRKTVIATALAGIAALGALIGGATYYSGGGPSGGTEPTIAPLVTDRAARVLYVVPNEQLWYADYAPTKERLEAAGVEVVTASSQAGRCQFLRDERSPNPPPVTADVSVMSDLSADDYDALVFGGFQVYPFIRSDETGDAVGRLIADFQTQHKPVAAMCTGQAVLAHHHVLDGLKGAGGKVLAENFPYDVPGGPEWTGRDLEVIDSGRIITAREDSVSDQFADALLKAIGRR